MSDQSQNPPPFRPGRWGREQPSPIHYRPPSPWAPSPPPLISGPRPAFTNSPRPMQSPGPGMPYSPMSPVPTGSAGLRGTRGPNLTQPRPRWPVPPPQQPQPFYQNQHPPTPTFQRVSPTSMPNYGGVNGPQPFQPMHTSSPLPTSSFQLSPTPSPVVCLQRPMDYIYNTQTYGNQTPQHGEYIGIPLEPPQPRSYVIYDDEEEQGPSTAEIIANQSQDYIDEKLAEYQMTILQLQGKHNPLFHLNIS